MPRAADPVVEAAAPSLATETSGEQRNARTSASEIETPRPEGAEARETEAQEHEPAEAAGSETGEDEPARPVPVLAPADHLRALEAANEAAEAAEAAAPAPLAMPEDRARAGEAEAPMPKFLDEPAEERAPPRHSAWVVLTATTVLAAFVIGALQMGMPDTGERLATLNTGGQVLAQPMRSVAKVERQEPARDPETLQHREGEIVQRRTEQLRAAATAKFAAEQIPSVPFLRFRNATVCADAASCGVAMWAMPRRDPPKAIEPALGAAVNILDRARRDEAGAAFPTGVTAIGNIASIGDVRAGAEIEANRPAVALPLALGDIGEVEIVLLPRDGSETGLAQVALRARGGRELARFDLKVAHPAGDSEPVIAIEEDRADEDVGVEQPAATPEPPATGAPSAAVEAPEPPPAATRDVAAPEKGSRKVKSQAPTRRTKTGQDVQRKTGPAADAPARPAATAQQAPAQPTAARQTAATPPPRGLFMLEPPSEASPPSPAAPTASKGPERSPNDFASQPTPQTANQAPGMETLMGLGGGFAADGP